MDGERAERKVAGESGRGEGKGQYGNRHNEKDEMCDKGRDERKEMAEREVKN